MNAPTLLLSAALFGAGPLPVAPPPAGPSLEEGALAAYIDPPAVYVELFDLSRLEADVRQSGLGRLMDTFLPMLEEQMDGHADEVFDHLGIDPFDLAGGQLSWEDAIATSVARLARDELGMSEGDAVRVAASLGARFSMVVNQGAEEEEEFAAAWSLRPGGAAVILDTLVPHLETLAGEDVPQPIHVERGADGVRAAWQVEDDEPGYIVLRDELIAVTNSEPMMRRVLGHAASSSTGGQRRAVSSEFHDARVGAMQRGDSLWAWIDGSAMRRSVAQEGPRAVQRFELLGLDGLENLQLALAGSEGQLTSRLRLEKRRSEGLLGLFRGRAADWRGLNELTADSIAVAGLTRPPTEVLRELVHMVAQMEDTDDVAAAWSMAESSPLLGDLLTPGMLHGESVVFVRPGAAGIPMVYATMQAGPELRQRLDRLQDGTPAFHGEATLRIKEIGGERAWMLGDGSYGLAVQSHGDTLLASYSLLALQDYQRQRQRERADDRQALIAGVRESMRQARAATGRPASEVAGFLHVRVEPLAEMAWPWIMMGLSMSGVEGLEDLPDAVEIAEEIGDTTLILFESSNVLELRGRGLFGGLGVLF
jgi:hypothetical protein